MPTPSTTTASSPAPPDGSTRLGTTRLANVTAYLMVGVDSTVVNVALPDIQRDLGFSPISLSWVLNSYTLAFGGLLLLGGTLGLSILVTVYGTATRHTHGSPSHLLVEGSARAFGVSALIAVTALLVCGSGIKGNRPQRTA